MCFKIDHLFIWVLYSLHLNTRFHFNPSLYLCFLTYFNLILIHSNPSILGQLSTPLHHRGHLKCDHAFLYKSPLILVLESLHLNSLCHSIPSLYLDILICFKRILIRSKPSILGQPSTPLQRGGYLKWGHVFLYQSPLVLVLYSLHLSFYFT